MDQIGTTGASGQGFISEAAGPLLLLVLAAVLLAIPLVRETVGRHIGDIRKHFAGPSPSAEATNSTPNETADTAEGAQAGRASDRDDYEDFFDRSVLAIGDSAHDDPSH